MDKDTNSSSFRNKLGFCLILSGVPLAMLLNFYFPVVSWSPIIMFLAIICLFNGFHFSVLDNTYLSIIFLFQILMIIYWFMSEERDYKMLSFHAFILALLFVVNKNYKLLLCDYLKTLMYFTGGLSLVFAFLEYNDYFSFEYWYERGKSTALERTLEVFTANIAAYTNMIACLLLFSRNNKYRYNIFLFLLCLVDLYVISYSGKRSFFVAAVFAICYIGYKTKVYVKNISVLVALVLILLFVPEIQDRFVELYDNTVSGFNDVYVDKLSTYDENSSSSIRAFALAHALEELHGFSRTELILGRGYLEFFIDNPLLESYLDMGVLGLIFYFVIIVLRPIIVLISGTYDNRYLTMALLLCLLHTFICITNNNPYQYFAYTPAILLALYSSQKNSI